MSFHSHTHLADVAARMTSFFSEVANNSVHNTHVHKSNLTDGAEIEIEIEIENFPARIIEIEIELKFNNRNITNTLLCFLLPLY